MATCWRLRYYDVQVSRVLGIATLLVGLLFVGGAAVQYNDPDPLRWIAMYLAAAIACFAFRRTSWASTLAAVTGVVALLWGLTLAIGLPRWVAPATLFEPMKSLGGAVEVAREMWGLLLIFLWMLLLVWRRRPSEN